MIFFLVVAVLAFAFVKVLFWNDDEPVEMPEDSFIDWDND